MPSDETKICINDYSSYYTKIPKYIDWIEIISNRILPSESESNFPCGITRHNSRILNGDIVSNHKWPWIGQLKAINQKIEFQHFCTVVLIGKQHVLTESDTCSYLIRDYDQVYIVLGDILNQDLPEPETVNRVIERNTYGNFLVLKLEYAVKFSEKIIPICLPDPTTPSDTIMLQNSFLAGW